MNAFESLRIPMPIRRRSFLSLATLPGFALVMPYLANASSDISGCEASANPSETLFAYTFLLDSVFIDEFLAQTEDLRKQLNQCRRAMEQVFGLAEDLLNQVRHLTAATDFRNMRSAVHRGKRTTLLLEASATSSNPVSRRHYVGILEELNEEVDAATQNLLPVGKVVLDGEAKKKLQELLDSIAQAHRMFEIEKTKESTDESKIGEQSRSTSKLIFKIRSGMLEAASELASKTQLASIDEQTKSSVSRRVQGLQQAIEGLNEMLSHRVVRQRDQAEVVLQLLRTLETQARLMPSGFMYQSETRLLPASYSTRKEFDDSGVFGNSASLPPGDFWVRVGNTLGSIGFRPNPASFIQISLCIALFSWIWGQSIKVEDKSRIIAKVLQPEHIWRWLGGGDDHEKRIPEVSAKLAQITFF
jgi:hypothetical protein